MPQSWFEGDYLSCLQYVLAHLFHCHSGSPHIFACEGTSSKGLIQKTAPCWKEPSGMSLQRARSDRHMLQYRTKTTRYHHSCQKASMSLTQLLICHWPLITGPSAWLKGIGKRPYFHHSPAEYQRDRYSKRCDWDNNEAQWAKAMQPHHNTWP